MAQEEFTIGQMIIPDKSGHTPVLWDTREPETVEAARAAFVHAKDVEKRAPMAMDAGGATGAIVDTFDPTHELYMMTPQVVGG